MKGSWGGGNPMFPPPHFSPTQISLEIALFWNSKKKCPLNCPLSKKRTVLVLSWNKDYIADSPHGWYKTSHSMEKPKNTFFFKFFFLLIFALVVQDLRIIEQWNLPPPPPHSLQKRCSRQSILSYRIVGKSKKMIIVNLWPLRYHFLHVGLTYFEVHGGWWNVYKIINGWKL